MLENEHINIVLAASGQEALDYARQNEADMVLMDIRMPDMDGVQTTQALRRINNSWARCPIIAVTAHVLSDERQQWLVEGLDDVLVKPINETQLQQQFQRFLGITLPTSPLLQTPPKTPALGYTPTSLSVIDLELGTRLAGGNPEFAKQQLKRLIDSLSECEQHIRSAFEENNLTVLLDHVHALNGASRYCGAPELALTVETLETRLRTGGLEQAENLLDKLYTAIKRLREQRSTLNQR